MSKENKNNIEIVSIIYIYLIIFYSEAVYIIMEL